MCVLLIGEAAKIGVRESSFKLCIQSMAAPDVEVCPSFLTVETDLPPKGMLLAMN